MTRLDQYYFTDSIFQLELNLHNIRRELILMLEEFENKDCCSCLQLKCRCAVKSPEKNTNQSSHNVSGNNSKEGTPNKAPSADLLPKPRFEKEVERLTTSKEGNKDIEAWIKSSRTIQKAKAVYPLPADVLLALQKSWSESRIEMKKEKSLEDLKKQNNVLHMRHAAANAVEVFFNSFKVQPSSSAANLAAVTNAAAIYGNHKSRTSEYTYF